MKLKKFIIVGFGRSGTTWLSDIVSKIFGGIVLFEPFHPKVYPDSQELCYNPNYKDLNQLVLHVNKNSQKISNNHWLLRNHVNDASGMSSSFIQYVWNNSEIIGFKTIRCNHLILELSKAFNSHVILIHRHPFAVLSSILKRTAFWKEYGVHWHKEQFFSRALNSKQILSASLPRLQSIVSNIEAEEEMIVCMWGLSFIISFKEVKEIGGSIISYEDLYLDPYAQMKTLLTSLGYSDVNIHPSYLFTPSMTTLSTIHGKDEFSSLTKDKLNELFWKSNINLNTAKKLNWLLSSILKEENSVFKYALKKGYIWEDGK